MSADRSPFDPVAMGLVAWFPRLGASELQIRYSDDESPIVWMAVAKVANRRAPRFEAAAALDPSEAVKRLAAQLIDGGVCVHCGKPTGFESDWTVPDFGTDILVCWVTYDPELDRIRLGCGGAVQS